MPKIPRYNCMHKNVLHTVHIFAYHTNILIREHTELQLVIIFYRCIFCNDMKKRHVKRTKSEIRYITVFVALFKLDLRCRETSDLYFCGVHIFFFAFCMNIYLMHLQFIYWHKIAIIYWHYPSIDFDTACVYLRIYWTQSKRIFPI